MRKGFTLIELLVVIAILAILAAILFPVFTQARDRARTQKCLAHGRELAQACLMYMGDHDDRFPSEVPQSVIDELTLRINHRYDWPGTPSCDESQKPWSMHLATYRCIILKGYVKNDAIWICPNPAGLHGKRYAFGYLCNWFPREEDRDWGTSGNLGFVDGDRGFQDPDAGRGRTANEVMALDLKGESQCGPRYVPPTKKIFWSCYAMGIWGRAHIGGGAWLPAVFPDYPHNGGTIYVYVDGHAAWKRTGKAWAPVGYTKLSMDEDPSKK